MNNKLLIDKFKEIKRLTSDRQVAEALEIDAGFLSSLKNEKCPMPIGLKFRLLDHINFSTETQKFANQFIDPDEHSVCIQQDNDRVENISKRLAGEQGNFVDRKWIERVLKLQAAHSLTDEQAAKYLDISTALLNKVKSGTAELTMLNKALLLGLLATEKGVGEKRLKKNLDARPSK